MRVLLIVNVRKEGGRMGKTRKVSDLSSRDIIIPVVEEALGRKISLDMEVDQLKEELADAGLDGETTSAFMDLIDIGCRKAV